MSTNENDDIDSKTINSDDLTSSITRQNTDTDNITNTSNENVVFLLKAVGGAPILKKKKWVLPRSRTIGFIAEFLKSHMKLNDEHRDQLVLYVNQAFAPALDTSIGAVNDCFRSEGTLVLHYALTPAWG